MEDNSIDVRMERAISEGSLSALARSLKAEGMSQREMYDLFSRFAKAYQDSDETKYDRLVDTMDYIVGYCTPSRRLFDTDLDFRT